MSAGRGRILVVDDEPMIVRVVGRVLAREHEVTVLDNAREAFERIRAGEHFDFILCDLAMPGMSGMELHHELLGLAPDQAEAMAFMTGGAFGAEAQAFLDHVANPRLDKPFTTAQLLDLVNERLRRASGGPRPG